MTSYRKKKQKEAAGKKGRQPARGKITRGSLLSAHIAAFAAEKPGLFVAGVPTSLTQSAHGGYAIFRELCRTHTELAIQTLASALSATRVSESGIESADFSVRVKAAQILLEHGWGRPVQAVAVKEEKAETQGSNIISALSNEKLEEVIEVSLKASAEDSAESE